MTRTVTLHLDRFGQEALDRLSGGRDAPVGAFRTAILYYLADRDSARPAWRAPRFSSKTSVRPGLEIELDDQTWAELEDEASRQGVRPEDLAVHALLYFLADLDSGRLPGRIEARFREDP